MQNSHCRPPIEANITPNEDVGINLTRQEDGSITVFTLGKIESGGKTSRDREIVITLHPPITESSVTEDKDDFRTQLSKLAQDTFRHHARSSEKRTNDGRKPDDAVSDIR